MMRTLSILLLLHLLYACGSGTAVPVPHRLNASRLQALIYTDSLLPGNAIAAIAGRPAIEVKVQRETLGLDSSSHSVLFSWPNGHTKTITTTDKKQLRLTAYSSLGVRFIRKTDLSAFSRQYESKENVKKQIDQLVNDKNTDPDLAIAEAKYLANLAKMQQFKKMEQVGEMAYWETPVQALHVFAKGYAFTITTNLETPAESLDKAMQLAALIFKNSTEH